MSRFARPAPDELGSWDSVRSLHTFSHSSTDPEQVHSTQHRRDEESQYREAQ